MDRLMRAWLNLFLMSLICALVFVAFMALRPAQATVELPDEIYGVWFVLHKNCPEAPADAVLVACAFVVRSERGPDCYILFAPGKVIQQYGKEWKSDADLFVHNFYGASKYWKRRRKRQASDGHRDDEGSSTVERATE